MSTVEIANKFLTNSTSLECTENFLIVTFSFFYAFPCSLDTNNCYEVIDGKLYTNRFFLHCKKIIIKNIS